MAETQIPLKWETKKRLARYGRPDDTYDTIVLRLLGRAKARPFKYSKQMNEVQ